MTLRDYRKSFNLTQEELAEKLEISWRQMQRIEKGKCFPSLQTLKKLVLILNISDKDLAQYIKSL